MKKIKLTRDKYALVDDADFEWLNQWKWCFDGAYAASRINGRKIRMHRWLLGEPENQVDHKDTNKLNYQRSNLRIVTHAENTRNRNRASNNTSGHKGIWWDKLNNKWCAEIKFNGKKYFIGRFLDIKEASKEREKFVYRLHGEFGRIN